VQSIGGSVTFVDTADANGFIAASGSQNVYPTAGQAASPIPISGTLSGFTVDTGTATAGSVTLTLFDDGSATAITCTITTGQSTCSSGVTVALTTSDTISVKIQNASGSFVRNVVWTAQL